MSFADKTSALVSRKGLALIAGVVLFYALWLYGLSYNPPGFYIDEACIAYNGYLIATTGAEEDGKSFPLYIHCYTQGWSQYMSAGQPYGLALLYLFISPSVLSARIFAATLVYIAILLLGLLSAKISERTSVGIIVALSAMATPWLFEYSRLVMETFVLIFTIVLFVYFLYNASRRERWKNTDVLLLSLILTVITYSYATGRVIGPLFTFGLLIFAVSWRAFFDVMKVWVIYALTMIPMIMVYLKDPLVISGRFLRATNLSKSNSLFQNIGEVISALWQDISLNFFIFKGDELMRHHIPESGMGEILVGTFALGLLGIVIILMRHRSSLWWRFVLYGAFTSMLPGAITFERNHSMRALAFPIFFMLFTVPAISWLLGVYDGKDAENKGSGFFSGPTEQKMRRGLLVALLLFTAIQAIQFQRLFRTNGVDPARKSVFHESFERVFDRAMAEEGRPIYLHDSGEPTYILGLWFAAQKGIDKSNFVHLLDRQEPPEGALVISQKTSCSDCQKIYEEGFLLYRNQKPDMSQTEAPVPANPASAPSVFKGGAGNEPGHFSTPRGLAVDTKGNIYVADGGNGRGQKFDADGKFVIEFGKDGPAETLLKNPNGVAVDSEGTIYVVDVSVNQLIKFNEDGVYAGGYDGPDTGFYGPRDISVGPNKQLYILDQGRSRVAAFDPATNGYTRVWGAAGSNPEEFKDPTGIAIGDGFVFVADVGNGRVQVFDLMGKYVREVAIPTWQRAGDEYPDVVWDEKTKILYVSSNKTNEVLAFDADGNPLAGFKPEGDDILENPTALVIAEVNKKRWLYVLNSGSGKVSKFELQSPKKTK